MTEPICLIEKQLRLLVKSLGAALHNIAEGSALQVGKVTLHFVSILSADADRFLQKQRLVLHMHCSKCAQAAEEYRPCRFMLLIKGGGEKVKTMARKLHLQLQTDQRVGSY